MVEQFLTVDELAALLRTSTNAVYSQRHRNQAPGSLAVQVGRRLLWRKSDLDRWWDEVSQPQAVDAGR